MAIHRRLVLVAFAISLTACSGKPSDAEATRLFIDENKTMDALKFFDVENVKKVNGYERNAQQYVVEMQYDLLPKMDSQELEDVLTREAGNTLFGRQQLQADLGYLRREFGTFKKGQRFTKKRPMVLVKTEAGWALASRL